MISIPYDLKSIHEIVRAPSWSHEEYLANIVPWPWLGLGDKRIKPRVRVKMGRNVVTVREEKFQCSRKVPHETMQGAFAAMVQNHGNRPEFGVYNCPHCQMWHVGHRVKVQA